MTAPSASLGGITFDSATEDDHGIVWCMESLDGWWWSSDLDLARQSIPMGESLTNVHEKARALTLRGTAFLPPGGQIPLGDLWFVAQRSLSKAMRLEYVPDLLVVTEPDLELQAYVRRAGSIRTKVELRQRAMTFEVPLLATDPRRYLSTASIETITLSGTDTTETLPIVNNGDKPTQPLITITGPALNPYIINDSESFGLFYGDPDLGNNHSLGGGDVLVLDCSQNTAILNGTDNVLANLAHFAPPSVFWDLLPDTNSIRFGRDSGATTSTAQIEYRDAYS